MGTRIKVTRVERVRPPMTTTDRDCIISTLPPKPSAEGSRPNTVVRVVIMMGRRRVGAAKATASRAPSPRSRRRMLV